MILLCNHVICCKDGLKVSFGKSMVQNICYHGFKFCWKPEAQIAILRRNMSQKSEDLFIYKRNTRTHSKIVLNAPFRTDFFSFPATRT